MDRSSVLYLIGGISILVIYGLLDPQIYPFPKCPFLSFTGWMCPGCGSQRAIHQVLHGQIACAFQLNALFIPALVYGMTGYGVALLLPQYWPGVRERWFSIRAAKISIVVILLFWVGRNLV